MDYKEVVNEQIEILQKKQVVIINDGFAQSEKICLIASTIAELAAKASLIPAIRKEVANNG